MRLLATPSFSEKVTRSDNETKSTVADLLNRLEAEARDQLMSMLEALPGTDEGIYVYKTGATQVFISFGVDEEGEYALLVDLIVKSVTTPGAAGVLKDPRRNPLVDPNRNMGIDPRRNPLIDPRRNMMVDPHRNMMIDPRRNMMIDPRRNMMVDPRRNTMIDPQRNQFIDPRRNWLLNPRNNSLWNGPYLYDVRGVPTGFFVRASDSVANLFAMDATYVGPAVAANKNYNLFDRDGRWTGFLVSNGGGGFNSFDVSNVWNGFVTSEIVKKADDVWDPD